MSSEDTKFILEQLDDKLALLLENIEAMIDNRLHDLFDQKFDQKLEPFLVEQRSHRQVITDHSMRLSKLESASTSA